VRPNLTVRIYLFAVSSIAVTITAWIVTIIVMIRPPGEGQARAFHTAFAEMVASVPDDPMAQKRLETTIRSLAKATGAEIAIVDANGGVLVSSTGADVRPEPGADAIPLHGDGRLADAVLIMRRPRPSPPLAPLLISVALVMSVMFAASVLFARSLAKPLRRLASAAASFGRGDLAARARITRRDELGEVGRTFDDMAERITTLLARQRELVASVSHELRTPVARIRVALELIEENPGAAPQLLAGLSLDLSELAQMIDDILLVGKLDASTGDTVLRTEPTTPDAIIESVVTRWHQRHALRSLSVRTDPGLPALHADPVLLRRVLDNLLDNAAKYSPDDQPVTIETKRHDDGIEFAVIDRGIGMTQEDLTRAFEPFWRSDRSRTRGTGGAGLGLAMARRIAQAHEGDVTLESVEGRGTIARVRVPLR
jgi:signal transduction histidine kinase